MISEHCAWYFSFDSLWGFLGFYLVYSVDMDSNHNCHPCGNRDEPLEALSESLPEPAHGLGSDQRHQAPISDPNKSGITRS